MTIPSHITARSNGGARSQFIETTRRALADYRTGLSGTAFAARIEDAMGCLDKRTRK